MSTVCLALGLLCAGGLEIFDLAAALDSPRLMIWKYGSIVMESLLPLLWLGYAATFARKAGELIPLHQKIFLWPAAMFPAAALVLGPADLYFAPDFAAERILFLQPAGYFFYLAPVVLTAIALLGVERTLFSLPAPERWRVKFELIGVGALLSMYLVYYGQALLHRTLDMNLLPARAAVVTLGSALIAYSRLRRGGRVEVRVSGQIAFGSVVLLCIGAYLIGMGILQEGMRRFGDSFQRASLLTIAFLAGVLLLVCLLSEKYTRKIKVLIHKNFYKSKYDYRSQWLACTERIASARSEGELQHTILSLFCETFAFKGAVLYLRESESGDLLPVASHETPDGAGAIPRDAPLVEILARREWIFDAGEIGGQANRYLPDMEVSFLVPLVSDGRLEGVIALAEPIDAKEVYIYEDFDLMRTLARQAVSTILHVRLAEELYRSRELAALGRISTFLLHDLKNLVSNLALVVRNAESHMENPEFRRDMLGTLGNSVEKMRALIARLKNLEEKTELKIEICDLRDIAGEAASLVRGEVRIHGGKTLIPLDREEIGRVVLNLLVNAVEAGGEPVEMEVGFDQGAFVRVRDHGCGMAEDFLQRHLFKPFKTTKAGGFGIGLYQCKNIVEAHGGSITVVSTPGLGSEFLVRFPPPGGPEGGEAPTEGRTTRPKPGLGHLLQSPSREEMIRL